MRLDPLRKSYISKLCDLFSAVTAGLFLARRQLRIQLTCGLTVLAIAAGSVAAQTTPGKSFPIRGGTQPFAIAMGEDGNFWFTLSNSSKVARITPRGSINYVRTPTLSNPAFITPGPDGNIWFGEGSTGKIASVTPHGVITEYLLFRGECRHHYGVRWQHLVYGPDRSRRLAFRDRNRQVY